MTRTLAQHMHFSRGRFLRWLRRTHGWLGLWGAVLGLLFGATGFLLNHRAVMKIPAAQMEQSEVELALPAERPKDAKALATWLKSELKLTREPLKVGSDPAKTVIWNGQSVEQPAQWKVDFHAPQYSYTAEYFVGNNFVKVKKQDANAYAFLVRLHKGVGMNNAWILLVDSLAGALVILSLTGVLLWTKMRGSRLAMAGLTGGSLLLALLFTLQSL